MIIESTNALTTNLPKNGGEFTIAATAHAFQILSSGVYEHKIAAVVREYMTNALDSHVQANKEDVPFTVTIPTHSHPHFEVEDYGIGMDFESATKIYTQYFNSTKTATNEVAGGFGLGGKSFLAYTNQMTVRFRKNGEENTAVIYLDDSNVPRMDVLHTGKTTECDGVKVSIPVNPSDFYQFKSEVEFYSSFYRVTPNFTREVTPMFDPENFKGDNNYVFVSKFPYYNGAALSRSRLYVLVGPVPYPINLHQIDGIPDHVRNHFTVACGSGVQFVRAKIGEVSIAASRESLSLDKRSCAKISDLLTRVMSEQEAFAAKICESGDHPRKILQTLGESLPTNCVSRVISNYSVLRKFVSKTSAIPKLKVKRKTKATVSYSSSTNSRITYSTIAENVCGNKLKILVLDSSHRKIKELYNNAPEIAYHGKLTKTRKSRIESIVGCELEPVYYSELYKQYAKSTKSTKSTEAQSATPRKKLQDSIAVCSGVTITKLGCRDFSNIEVDLSSDNVFWIDVVDSHYDSSDYYYDAKIFVKLSGCDSITVVRKNTKTSKKLERNGVIGLSDMIQSYVDDNFDDLGVVSIGRVIGRYKSPMIETLIACGSRIVPDSIKEFYDYLDSLKNSKHAMVESPITDCFKRIRNNIEATKKKIVATLDSHAEVIGSIDSQTYVAYPLLEHMYRSSICSENQTVLNELKIYIAAKDAQEKH